MMSETSATAAGAFGAITHGKSASLAHSTTIPGEQVLPHVLHTLADRARAVAAEHPEALPAVGRFRDATRIGRNITMPVPEYFDAQGLTVRVPEGRRVRG